MATHSLFLPGKSHGQRSLVSCSPWGLRVGHDLPTKQQQQAGLQDTDLGIGESTSGSGKRQWGRALLGSSGHGLERRRGGKVPECKEMLLLLLLSHFSRVRFFATPWTAARQAPLSMGFSRQEYWSGLLLPSPGDLLHPGVEAGSPALQADSLLSENIQTFYY